MNCRHEGRPRKTEKAAPKTPSACTSKMFTSSAQTIVKWCPEIDYPSKNHIDDDNMVKVENEPPRRGRGRPRKKLKAAAEVSSPSTSKILRSSVKTGDVEALINKTGCSVARMKKLVNLKRQFLMYSFVAKMHKS
ncbi:uncharacterized protein DS421_9g257730 [Arachis hypogaea]|nr:uncharacterized protein DS421_9g257730 [Arachis hypogaea]